MTTQKEIKVNLRDEYVRHLKNMSQLNIFKNIKMLYDHMFFKSIVLPQLNDEEASQLNF